MAAIIFFLISAIFILPGVAYAGISCTEWVGRAVAVEGDVQAVREGETQQRPVHLNDTYCTGDTIKVRERSRAVIMLTNDSVLRLDQKSTITFSGVDRDKTFLVSLRDGMAHFFSHSRRSLKVNTPFVNATIGGTEFLITVQAAQTDLSVFEGKVEFANDKGRLSITSGQSAVAVMGQAPVPKVTVKPRDAVQWTLYYPPVFSERSSQVSPGPGADWRAKVSELLSVGRVDDAGIEISNRLEQAPGDSDALAVLSVIAVARNEKEQALDLARKGVRANPGSAAARLALSYALQARFDLQGALDSLREAVRIEPRNSLVRARLAEIWLSFGNLEEALTAAQEAVALSPESARAQSVLGFASLARAETTGAKEAFEKSILLDQADPLPRLGLGLAMIRDGRVAEGRQAIEIAASLDPRNSLIRSYLGKTFYEEKRDEKAAVQFERAHEFDPLDPTPLFYDAIQKQSLNRPVEALHDLRRAIELNDNRAVYRSKLLLDQDLAARSASLSGIYGELGFQQLAFESAATSVTSDPGNFSAHRFLSDSYTALPRHEIAKVSELLQAQLLQPITVIPVRPESAESKLSILEGAGPATPSFNEFNSLFNRNRVALQMSGILGINSRIGDELIDLFKGERHGRSNSDIGDELIVSGVYKNFSFSAGQFHYATDGFRVNNDLKQDIYNLFVQGRLSDKTSIQAEFRHKLVNYGDLSLNFLPGDVNSDKREKSQTSSGRFGFHHAFAPGSDLIGSFIYQRQDYSFDDPTPDPFGIRSMLKSYGTELQYLQRLDYLKLIGGLGFFKTTTEEEVAATVPSPPPDPPLSTISYTDSSIHHTNLYLYSYIDYLNKLTLTLGGSADFNQGLVEDRHQFNPKVGLAWHPIHETTLRAAAFRTLKRMLITDQTLEPTQVAGFSQFFDDPDRTGAWTYGVGIDQKFSRNSYGGAEYYKRDLNVPFQAFCLPPICDVPTMNMSQTDWKEQEARAYLYVTPHPWLGLSTEYLYEKFTRNPWFTAGILNVETHRIPLGIGFFHPSGFSARLKATYIHQKGTYQSSGSSAPDPLSIPTTRGADAFWIVDTGISYRLPGRLGIISLMAKNLLDDSFKYQDTDPVSPVMQPRRTVFLKITVAM